MKLIGNLQQFGRALMLPMMALPAAAVFLFLSGLPWDDWSMSPMAGHLAQAGGILFQALPYLFALGVALGLTGNAVAAGVSALAGMFIYTAVTGSYAGLGIQPTVLIGVVIGVAAGYSYEQFKDFRLPEYLQFFGGPRFVPLFVSFASLAFSIIMIEIAPWVQDAMVAFGEAAKAAGGFGIFLFGFTYRILVAFGLHHLVSHAFWFQVGAYETEAGTIVYGDLPRYFSGDPTAGAYMAGLYPIMMFGLPAIALAIIREAREDLKPKVRKTFISAALSSFLTGVTEPVEFAFMFAAPYLFVLHAFLSGLIMWLTYELGILHGFSFSAGAFDFFINLHLSTKGWMLLPIGLAVGIGYYWLFRWAIQRFDIPTPGREEGSPLDEWAGDIPYRAPLILQAIGGKDNIIQMEACITRLRLKLHDDRQLDVPALRSLGAAGVIRLGGGNVQIVFGTFSELIREEIMKVMKRDLRRVQFKSPVQGRMIPLDEVPDPIFAGRLVGGGVAFVPERGEAAAPVGGVVIHVHPAKHAVGIRTPEGLEVLLHVGIDTMELNGAGFLTFVKEGDTVVPGQPLLRFDLGHIRSAGKSPVTPMVITNPERVRSWVFAPFTAVKKGQASVMSVVLEERDGGGEKR